MSGGFSPVHLAKETDMLTKEQMHLECLRLALNATPTDVPAATIVDTAQTFLDFLSGTTDRAALAKEAKGAIDKLAG